MLGGGGLNLRLVPNCMRMGASGFASGSICVQNIKMTKMYISQPTISQNISLFGLKSFGLVVFVTVYPLGCFYTVIKISLTSYIILAPSVTVVPGLS